MDAGADLDLCCPHMPEDIFSQGIAQIRWDSYIIFFLFLHEKKHLGKNSNECAQHMFAWKNKKKYDYFLLKNVLYLELCHDMAYYNVNILEVFFVEHISVKFIGIKFYIAQS